MGTLLLKFLVGAVAGILAWMIGEPFAPKNINDYRWAEWENGFVLGLGGLIGLAVGGLDGFTRGGKRHTLRGLAMGLVLGAIGASFGHGVFGGIVRAVFGPSIFLSGALVAQMMARTVAFAGIGLCLGAAIGASSLNGKKILQGAIGGALGGAVAGSMFDPVSALIARATVTVQGGNEVGGPGRAVMALLLGASIGLFIGIVDRIARSAWLRLALGRNEGKEWSIDGPQTFIGRSEGAHVPLFGDANVAPIHASIQKHGGQYILIDGGSPIGTYLNGQRIAQAPLTHGSQIQIGSFTLQFLMKNMAAPQRLPDGMVAYPQPGHPAAQPVQAAAYQQTQAMPQPTMQQPMPGPGMPTQGLPGAASAPTMAYQPQQASGVAIVALDGPLMGQRFAIGGPTDVGRECPAIPMSFDSAASRRHANLAPAPNGLSITDAGSTNGTYVNDQRISQAFARIGDRIKIGSTTFRVEGA